MVLLGLQQVCPALYRANGSWLMNSATAGVLRKMQDADNRQIWTDSLAAGTLNMLME
ncbi:MAG: phage major capsid protein [Pseudomonadota bacterium]